MFFFFKSYRSFSILIINQLTLFLSLGCMVCEIRKYKIFIFFHSFNPNPQDWAWLIIGNTCLFHEYKYTHFDG